MLLQESTASGRIFRYVVCWNKNILVDILCAFLFWSYTFGSGAVNGAVNMDANTLPL